MLIDASAAGESGLIRLPLSARRAAVGRVSDENHAWNERALSLLARAGLIEFAHEAPPRRAPEEDEPAWEQRRDAAYDTYFSSRLVRQLEDVEGALGDGRAEHVRQLTRSADQRALDLMFQALEQGYSDIASLFGEAYRVSADTKTPAAWPSIVPQPSCGGCPGCRRAGRDPYEGVAPAPAPIELPTPNVSSALARWLPDPTGSTLTVLYERPRDQRTHRALERSLDDAVHRFVRHGVRLVCAPRDFLALLTEALASGTPAFQWPAVPALFVLPPEIPNEGVPESLFAPDRTAARVTVLCADSRDPERPTSTVGTTRHPSVSLPTILRAL
jgi:hypothetical protein